MLLVAAGTIGTAQLLAAEPPCAQGELCLYQPFSELLFSGAFLLASGLAAGAMVISMGSRLGAAVLGGLALAPVALVLLAFARSGDYPVPLWTMAGPTFVMLGIVAVIPPRLAAVLVMIVACTGVAAAVVVAFLAPPPSPIGTQEQIEDNLQYVQRRDPRPADVAALRPAAADLEKVLGDLQARHVFDDVSTSQALVGYPTLKLARVHPPRNARLFDRDTTVVVVMEHGSACLIGELGPTDESVHVVGLTLDGGCEALYGH